MSSNENESSLAVHSDEIGLGLKGDDPPTLRDHVVNATPWLLRVLGIMVGGWAAVAHSWPGGGSATATWMAGPGKGWELSAFGSFAAMSGFSLAALSFVASLRGHAEARDVLDSNAGRRMLSELIWSTWWWLLAGLVGFGAMLTPWSFVESLFLFAGCFAGAQGLVSLFSVSVFMRRYTVMITWKR